MEPSTLCKRLAIKPQISSRHSRVPRPRQGTLTSVLFGWFAAKRFDLFEDLFWCGVPAEWLWIAVVLVDVFEDGFAPLGNSREGTPSDDLQSNPGKETFNLVEPA
jgi:hypothetical protein